MGEGYFTDRELDVMSILWQLESGTVSDVRERLEVELAYTSVLSVLQTLEEKGYVRHESQGRAYRYIPTVGPEEAGGNALARIIDKMFHGAADALLAQLVSSRKLPKEQLERMHALLDARLRGKKGS
jgi:predicted transcriptional regulator